MGKGWKKEGGKKVTFGSGKVEPSPPVKRATVLRTKPAQKWKIFMEKKEKLFTPHN